MDLAKTKENWYDQKKDLWGLYDHTPEYKAWAWWLRNEVGVRFINSPMMAVIYEWPPSSQLGANMVVEKMYPDIPHVNRNPKPYRAVETKPYWDD